MADSATHRIPWDSPVAGWPGVGPHRAAVLARLEIHTLRDLLLHPPKRYEDRRQWLNIGDVKEPGAATVSGTVAELGVKRFGRGQRSVFTLVVDDGTGRLHCRWWNMPWLLEQYAKGQTLIVSGRVKELRPRTMDHPEIERLEPGEPEPFTAQRIVPVYPLTEGLGQRGLRGLVWRVLADDRVDIPEPYAPALLIGRPARAQAVRWLHFPDELPQTQAARQRLALEEFLDLQLNIQTRRQRLESHAPHRPCGGDNRLIRRFLPALGYRLTEAQTRVLKEIRADLQAGPPMRRLLQGDVGSGKTVTAACAALMVIESGFQAVLMAPTEVLAQQHGQTFAGWFEKIGVPVRLWTGSVKTAELAGSAPGLVIGTHALIEAGFAIERLGLAIIDEQHKFGVAQREELLRKGAYPHLLVMSATPIPRTLGLTLYGDLDASVLDEMPPGRKPVKTFVRTVDKLPKVWEFVRRRLEEGEQAYIVYPRVENDDLGKAVLKEIPMIQANLEPFRAAALHGKLKPEEKEAVMADFSGNRVQVLVASSLIEVGLDVPNATIMLIENAEQFGLAQLHQLRGRVGRGAKPGYCILISTAKTAEARERLAVLERSTDGFAIAEADLAQRGPGEFLGQGQSGLPRFKFGDLVQDIKLVREAKRIAEQLLRKANGAPSPEPSAVSGRR